jgi:hypothetical protein
VVGVKVFLGVFDGLIIKLKWRFWEMKKVRRWQCAFIIIALLFSYCFPVLAENAESATNFSDIQGHWAAKPINDWANKGIVGGYPDGTFQPHRNITRAEFMTWVNRAFGYTQTVPLNFSDVSENDWFALEIAKALAVGYIGGYPDGTVKPNDSISRQEVAVVLSKILEPKSTSLNLTAKFTDSADIPEWSNSAINGVVDNGYMGGYPDGTFKPAQPITRAEALTVLDRAVGVLLNEAGVYGSDEVITIPGNVTISAGDITLLNTVIDGNLYLTEGIGTGHVTLDNVQVKGTTKVSGGGENSIIIINSDLGPVLVDVPDNHRVRLVAQGTTTIGMVEVRTDAKLEESNLTGSGFGEIVVFVPQGAAVELWGILQR